MSGISNRRVTSWKMVGRISGYLIPNIWEYFKENTFYTILKTKKLPIFLTSNRSIFAWHSSNGFYTISSIEMLVWTNILEDLYLALPCKTILRLGDILFQGATTDLKSLSQLWYLIVTFLIGRLLSAKARNHPGNTATVKKRISNVSDRLLFSLKCRGFKWLYKGIF